MKWLSLILAILLAGCSASETPVSREGAAANTAGVSATHAISGLPLVTVTIDTGEERIEFLSELALTPEAQAKGLMFRDELPEFTGMLFPSASAQVRSFWMKNTPLPLDIIFIGPDRRIINIETGVPYSTDGVRSEGPAAAVFEIGGGRAAELGIEPGDTVSYELP